MSYLCSAGALTIGYGYNLTANPLGIDKTVINEWCGSSGISKLEAEKLLHRCVNDCTMQCERRFVWWSKLSKNRQNAVVNMVYNMGMKRLLGFEQMLRCLERGDWVTASAQALSSKWAKQVGGRAQRIALLIRTG
jgi:lysozyme